MRGGRGLGIVVAADAVGGSARVCVRVCVCVCGGDGERRVLEGFPSSVEFLHFVE